MPCANKTQLSSSTPTDDHENIPNTTLCETCPKHHNPKGMVRHARLCVVTFKAGYSELSDFELQPGSWHNTVFKPGKTPDDSVTSGLTTNNSNSVAIAYTAAYKWNVLQNQSNLPDARNHERETQAHPQHAHNAHDRRRKRTQSLWCATTFN